MLNITITEGVANEVLLGLIALEAQEKLLAHEAKTAAPYDGREGDVLYHKHRANRAHVALRSIQAHVPREFWPLH